MAKSWKSISFALRECVLFSGKNYTQLSNETGIPRPIFYRLLRGRSITLKHIETLVRYFKLTIVADHLENGEKTLNGNADA